MMRIELPIATISEANRRGHEHWAARAKRAKSQREAARLYAYAEFGSKPPQPPMTITMTRRSPRKLDEGNLAMSMKSIQDGLCDAIGIDDRTGTGIEWRYRQEKGKPQAVIVEIERGD